ncbi:O-antigen ligase family protein [Citricoccus sp.]|uniref:O-antigen ligase family protein n=1 Tax=Citricoccus sp. TaxID=1978372 RepID=UPI0028BE03A6|nr:O-antigen ligase family protein [Citricoccus sp.]
MSGTMMDWTGTGTPIPSAATRRTGVDAVTFLTIYLILLCAIPSYLTIPALGSVGRLSILWGLVGFVWWAFVRIKNPLPMPSRPAGVKIAAWTFFGVMFLSYAVAQLQGLTSEAATTADSGLLRLLSWLGVMLVALEGIDTSWRQLIMIRRVVLAGALMAALGLVQFVTGQSFVVALSLPGFVDTGHFESVIDRGGFARSAATASHPLEYGTMLCITLPLGLGLALSDVRRHWFLRWAPPLVIFVAVALSMSRSALIGVVVGLVLLAPVVPARYRLRAAVFGAALLVGISATVPGMIGTIRGMFNGIGTDASTTSRTDSADNAIQIALRDPWVGQGFGTFVPTELIMDNQMLLLLIEGGVLGVAAFLALIGAALIAGWRVGRTAITPRDRTLGPALAAGVAAGSVTLLFFDGFAFPIAASMLFLVYGIAGAALSVTRAETSP